ncbi:MAG: Asp23/Gls24 family envelope stress response protein [Atribacterota bacterium]
MQTIKTELGEINISKETIGYIVRLILVDIKGVAGSKKTVMNEITDMLMGNTDIISDTSSNIKIEIKDNKIFIDLFIIIKYGVRIPDIAWDIQNRIKEELIRKIGTDTSEINIHIQGIQFPKKAQSKKELVASDLFIQVF